MLEFNGSLNLLDIVLFIIFFYFMINGYKSGLIRQASKILGLIVSILIAINQFQEFQVYLEPYLDMPPQVLQIISFIIIFVFFNVVIHILSVILKRIINFLYLDPLDQIAGAGLGLLKGALFTFFIVFILNELPHEIINEFVGDSYFSTQLLELTPIIQENLKEMFGT